MSYREEEPPPKPQPEPPPKPQPEPPQAPEPRPPIIIITPEDNT